MKAVPATRSAVEQLMKHSGANMHQSVVYMRYKKREADGPRIVLKKQTRLTHEFKAQL